MTGNDFRELALSRPEAVESSHMDHPDFRVRKKIFASLAADEKTGAVKCDPASLDLLVQRDSETFRNAWGGRWLGIDLSRLDDSEAMELLEDAWRSIAPRGLVASYDEQARQTARPEIREEDS